MTDEQIKQYCDFMCSLKNIGNCKDCPENRGYDGHEANGHPCGQQNCWVVAHIRQFGVVNDADMD